MLLELSYKEFQAKLHPRKDPEEGEATAHRVKGWKKPNQPQDRNRKRNRGYRKPIGARVMEAILSERLGGKGYKPRKDYAGRRVSGDWENSDRGGGHKWKARVGKPVEKKSPTYLAYVKNKKKALNNSYELEGEFLGEFNSNEEVVLFVESLVEEGYTEQEILLELERKGLGTAILSKTLELGLGGVKNTIKLGKQVYNLGRSSRVRVDNLIGSVRKNLEKRSSGKYIKTSSNSGSGLNKNLPTGVKKAKTGQIQVKKRVEVLSPTTQKFKGKNITPSKVTTGVNKGISTAGAVVSKVSDKNNEKKVPPFQNRITGNGKKEVQPFQNRITGNGKKQVNPEKNPVVKTKPTERERSVDRAYGAQIAQTRKLKGDDAAKKLRQKFINRPITSKEMDESVKDELLAKARKAHKKAKNFKKWRQEAEHARNPLKKGEVRWMDKKTGKWKSNKK